jgi:transposase InsO family protein
VLDRSFEAPAPNRKWIADFTYIWTAEGWLYVAAVIDLFSRRVVGWSMSAGNEPLTQTDLKELERIFLEAGVDETALGRCRPTAVSRASSALLWASTGRRLGRHGASGYSSLRRPHQRK